MVIQEPDLPSVQIEEVPAAEATPDPVQESHSHAIPPMSEWPPDSGTEGVYDYDAPTRGEG